MQDQNTGTRHDGQWYRRGSAISTVVLTRELEENMRNCWGLVPEEGVEPS